VPEKNSCAASRGSLASAEGSTSFDVADQPEGRRAQGRDRPRRQLLGQCGHVLGDPFGLETQAPRVFRRADEPREDRGRLVHAVVDAPVGEEAVREVEERLQPEFARRRPPALPGGAPAAAARRRGKRCAGPARSAAELQEVPAGVVGQGLGAEGLERGELLPEVGFERADPCAPRWPAAGAGSARIPGGG
jgi:hypothetical protein